MYVALVIEGKLLHLAASAICVKTWPLRLRYASILPVPECDMRQSWEILNYDISKRGETNWRGRTKANIRRGRFVDCGTIFETHYSLKKGKFLYIVASVYILG